MKEKFEFAMTVAWCGLICGLTIMGLFYSCGGYGILRDHFEPTVKYDTVLVHDTVALPANYEDIVSYQKNVRRSKYALMRVISDIRGIDPFEQSSKGMSLYLIKVRESLNRLKKELDVTDSLGNIYSEGYHDGYDDGRTDGYEEGYDVGFTEASDDD